MDFEDEFVFPTNPSDERINEIEEHIYLGGFTGVRAPMIAHYPFHVILTPDEGSIEFKAILSVTSKIVPNYLRKDEVVYHQIIADDRVDQDLLTYFPETNEIIDNYQKSGQNIYIHCVSGISRSATVVIAYIMHKYRMTASNAISLVKSKRPVIDPNQGFVYQLELFEKFGFILNASNRQFRRYLFQNYIQYSPRTESVHKYFERRTLIEKSTPDLQLGPQYDCSICGQKLFNQIHIVNNSNDPNNVQNCPIIYIEPQQWMKELTESYDLSNGLIKCSNCKEGKAKFNQFFTRDFCDCVDHKNNQSIKIQMIDNSFKLHE